MKASEIKVGHVYRNRGQGRTMRKVLAIGVEYWPMWAGSEPHDRIGVLYVQVYASGQGAKGAGKLWLESFARWAGSEVQDET